MTTVAVGVEGVLKYQLLHEIVCAAIVGNDVENDEILLVGSIIALNMKFQG